MNPVLASGKQRPRSEIWLYLMIILIYIDSSVSYVLLCLVNQIKINIFYKKLLHPAHPHKHIYLSGFNNYNILYCISTDGNVLNSPSVTAPGSLIKVFIVFMWHLTLLEKPVWSTECTETVRSQDQTQYRASEDAHDEPRIKRTKFSEIT